MNKTSRLLTVALAGCAGVSHAAGPEVLMTDRHTLTVWAHCSEGEVGCAQLTAELVNTQSGQKFELNGSTYMVKCADRVTPCHVGFYDFDSPGIVARAYPDGTLELELPGSKVINEHGTWSY